MEEDIRKTIDGLTDLAHETIAKYAELLRQSEERIDRTNEMVGDMVSAIRGFQDNNAETLKQYILHINNLAQCRDELTAQNKALIDLVSELRADLQKERTRYDSLLQTLIQYVRSGSSANTINVK